MAFFGAPLVAGAFAAAKHWTDAIKRMPEKTIRIKDIEILTNA